MFNLLKKVVKSIFSFIFNLIRLFIWFILFAIVVYFSVRFFLKGEKNEKSFQKNLSN